MNSKKEVQHVYLVGAKSLGAYGGYETFVYKLTEYHQNKENIKYHVACKANGDGCMDESKFDGVTRINEHEFELHNADASQKYLTMRCMFIFMSFLYLLVNCFYAIYAERNCYLSIHLEISFRH